MNTTTIGVFKDRIDAEGAITDLRALGLRDSDISYVSLDKTENEVKTNSGGSSVGSGAASGVATGGIVGAIAGLAVATGILPGLGTLIVAGPIAAALGLTGAAATTAAGAMTGAAAGGIIGALTGLGVSQSDAREYESRIRRGGIVLVARSTIATAVLNVFAKYNAEEVREYNSEVS